MNVLQKPVLTVHNHHVPACGEPPDFETDSELRTGYFESADGEQWVLKIDPKRLAGVLFGGDCGWENPIQISEGRIDGDIILGGDVQRWIAIAWEAATGTSLFQSPFDVLLQKLTADDPHDTNAGPALHPDVAVAAYIRCGVLQEAADVTTEAMQAIEDPVGETEVVMTRHELQAITAAIDACMERASVPTH